MIKSIIKWVYVYDYFIYNRKKKDKKQLVNVYDEEEET